MHKKVTDALLIYNEVITNSSEVIKNDNLITLVALYVSPICSDFEITFPINLIWINPIF